MNPDIRCSRPCAIAGEVVEVHECEGQRLARIRPGSDTVIEVIVASLDDLHLGDRVVIDGALVVNRIRLVPETPAGPRST